MTKNEFLTQLAEELHRGNVADAADVVEEYEQHFAFKLADGYAEEEIARKLGDPAALAAQFVQTGASGQKRGNKAPVIVGLCFSGLVGGLFFVLLAAWGIVMAAAALACAAICVCLLTGLNIYGLIPSLPYWCGAGMALALAALAVLIVVGCIYYWAFLRQLVRAYGRFRYNALAAASGRAPLPAMAIHPQLTAKTNRRLRSVALVSLALFAACAVLSYIVCSLSAGTLEFWHAWGWFGYMGGN